MSVVMCTLILWTAPSQAELGGNPPRWSEADIADLNADLVALQRAERRLYRIATDSRQLLGIARQKQLLGTAEEGPVLEQALRDWWLANVVGPAMRIAENPGAPCKLAQIVLTKLVSAERQAQLLGMDTSSGMDVSNPDSLISRALKVVKRRCLEQAYDACMASGNGEFITLMLGSAVRQFEILSLQDLEFEAQAVYLYRRCTVYQLRYHSETRVDGKASLFGTSSDGSVILLSDVDPASGVAGLAKDHEWKGPRASDPDDVIVSVTDCESHLRSTRLVCGAMQPKIPARAGIKAGDLSMQRFYDEIEVNLSNDETELEELTRLAKRIPKKAPITWVPKSEGTDTLTLTYEPGVVFGFATLSGPVMTMSLPVPPPHATFLIAHAGGKFDARDIKLAGWTRVGVQVLFEKPIKVQATVDKILNTDTSKFELAHRPDLFPSDEIVAKWELTAPPVAPAPSRTPAQPGAAPR
jgi:hypothetical protein